MRRVPSRTPPIGRLTPVERSLVTGARSDRRSPGESWFGLFHREPHSWGIRWARRSRAARDCQGRKVGLYAPRRAGGEFADQTNGAPATCRSGLGSSRSCGTGSRRRAARRARVNVGRPNRARRLGRNPPCGLRRSGPVIAPQIARRSFALSPGSGGRGVIEVIVVKARETGGRP